MGNRVRAAMTTVAMAVAAAFVWAGAVPLAGQTAAAKPPQRIGGKPNLTGLWQALTEANWDLQAHEARPGPSQFGALFAEPAGVGVVEGNEIPYEYACHEGNYGLYNILEGARVAEKEAAQQQSK